MKRPLVLFAICVSAFGCLILTTCTYYTLVFGRGDTEIGNFNRFSYTTKLDPTTMEVERSWADAPTTERSLFYFVNMWAVGAAFLVTGPATVALELALLDTEHF